MKVRSIPWGKITFWFEITSTFPSVAAIKTNKRKNKEENMQCKLFFLILVYKIYQPTVYFLRFSVSIFKLCPISV